jgi:23S rRNA pseudouridine1911/1915/1917 synthase
METAMSRSILTFLSLGSVAGSMQLRSDALPMPSKTVSKLTPVRSRLAHPSYAVVAEGTAPEAGRISDVLRSLWPERFPSASAAKKAVRRSLVVVGSGEAQGGRNVEVVEAGERLRLLARVEPGPAPGEGRRGTGGDDAPLECVYDDDYFAVVYKPAGIDVGAVRTRLAVGMQPTNLREEPLWRPQHVHRLDLPTSGLLVCAKTGAALRVLTEAFRERQVRKRYRAILAGRLEPLQGICSEPLSGQDAHTKWNVVQHYESASYGTVTLVDLMPHTGRTHQLRRHAAMLGHPIVGDARYWGNWQADGTSIVGAAENREEAARQAAEWEQRGITLMLSAVQLDLPHPSSGEPLSIECEQPQMFDAFCEMESAAPRVPEGEPNRHSEQGSSQ